MDLFCSKLLSHTTHLNALFYNEPPPPANCCANLSSQCSLREKISTSGCHFWPLGCQRCFCLRVLSFFTCEGGWGRPFWWGVIFKILLGFEGLLSKRGVWRGILDKIDIRSCAVRHYIVLHGNVPGDTISYPMCCLIVMEIPLCRTTCCYIVPDNAIS